MTNMSILALTEDQTPRTRIEVAGSADGMFATQHQPEWFDSVLSRLKDVANLADDWDSYGAQQVDQISVHFAHLFLSCLTKYGGISGPKITATPDGNVAFIWDDDFRSLEVELDEMGIASYFLEPETGDGEDRQTEDFMEIIDLLTQLQVVA